MFNNEEEIKRFVQRQLVETRQISKYVKNILKEKYTNTYVRTLKARLTDTFRMKYQITKVRELNDFHHAHDAYIISIVGNAIFRGNNKVKESDLHLSMKEYFDVNRKNKGVMEKVYNSIANKEDDIKDMFYTKNVYHTNLLTENTGEFYNQTIQKKSDKSSLIPLKKRKGS